MPPDDGEIGPVVGRGVVGADLDKAEGEIVRDLWNVGAPSLPPGVNHSGEGAEVLVTVEPGVVLT